MPVTWIEARGRKLLFVDYRGLRAEQMLELLEVVRGIVAEAPAKPLVLCDYTDAPASMEYLTRIQQIGRELFNDGTEKIGMLGISGLKGMFMDAYLAFTGTRNLRAFATEAEAFDWLCGPAPTG